MTDSFVMSARVFTAEINIGSFLKANPKSSNCFLPFCNFKGLLVAESFILKTDNCKPVNHISTRTVL